MRRACVLVHMLSRNKSDWRELPDRIRDAGITALDDRSARPWRLVRIGRRSDRDDPGRARRGAVAGVARQRAARFDRDCRRIAGREPGAAAPPPTCRRSAPSACCRRRSIIAACGPTRRSSSGWARDRSGWPPAPRIRWRCARCAILPRSRPGRANRSCRTRPRTGRAARSRRRRRARAGGLAAPLDCLS